MNILNQIKLSKKISKKYLIKEHQHFKHNLLNVILFLLLLTLFFTLCYFLTNFNHIFYYAFSVPLFGWILFSLFIIVVHEASHNMFFKFKNQKLQNSLNFVIAWPVCSLSFQEYNEAWAKGHVLHHQVPTSKDDPQNCGPFCMYGFSLFKKLILISIVPGYTFFVQNSCLKKNKIWPGVFSGFLIWTLILFCCLYFSNIYLFFSLLFSTSISMALNLIKVSMEHSGRLIYEPHMELRSKSSIYFLRLIMTPFNVSLHFEHHIAPFVPWYNLYEYHRELRKELDPQFQKLVFNLGTKETLYFIKNGKEAHV